MNKSFIFNILLAIAVAVLYVIHFTCGSKSCTSTTAAGESVNSKIVYVNTDSLIRNYQMAIDLNEAFLKKQEDRNTIFNKKAKEFDTEAYNFQQKAENGGFLSQERAESARKELVDKQQKLQQLQQDMTSEAYTEQEENNKKLLSTITEFLKEYNKDKGYDIILSTINAGTVLYSEDGFDITNDVIDQLNAKYQPEAKAAK